MSLIWTSRARTKQPQGESGLSLGNPIARGLKFIETGYGRDIKDGRLPVAGTATKTVGPPGRGLTFNGSSDYQRYVNPTGFTVPLSLFIVFTVSSVPNSTVFGLFSSTSDTNGIVALRTVAGSIAVYTYEPTTGYVESAYTAGVPTGVVLTAGASVSAAGGKTAYLAGVPTATTTHAISLSASDRLSIGQLDRASPGDYFPGTIFLAAAWDRVLSAAEFAELNRNPWQLFAPEQSPRFFSFANVLFSKLDETTASNTDYITTSTAGSVAEMQLGSVTDPGVDTLHSIKLRASGSGSLQVDLVQGSGALLTIWTSKTRTAQPPVLTAVNWADSLTRGLRILDHGQLSGRRADPKLQDVVSDSAVSADTVGGVARRGTLGKLHTPFDLSVTEAATFFAVGRFAAPEQNDCRLVVKAGGSSGMTGVAVHGGSQKLRRFSVAGNTTSWELSLDVPAASIYSYASQILTIDAAGNCVAYLDGVVVGTGSITGGMVTRTDQKFTTIGGGYADNTTNAAAVDLLIGGVFDRALSGVEAWLLSRRYWQLFAPERRPRHIPAAKPIASRTIPLIATPTDYRRELLPAEAALITNYADLRVRLRGV